MRKGRIFLNEIKRFLDLSLGQPSNTLENFLHKSVIVVKVVKKMGIYHTLFPYNPLQEYLFPCGWNSQKGSWDSPLPVQFDSDLMNQN